MCACVRAIQHCSSSSDSIMIFSCIYMCACVCVCVCAQGLYSPLSPCGGDDIDESSLTQDIREVSMEQSEVVLQYFCELLRQHCGPGEDCAIKASWRLPVSE